MRLLPVLAVLLLLTLRAGAAPLDAQVQRIVNQGRAKQALWGVYAVDVASGKELAAVNADRLFVPASNRKLIPAALASKYFDADERLSTTFGAVEVSAGTVRGAVLRAAGDPSWTPELLKGRSGRSMLRQIAKELAAAGVRRIDGDITIDASLFEEPAPLPPGWSWDEFTMSYAPSASVLAIDKNLVGVAIAPGGTGAPPQVSFNGDLRPFEVVNSASTGRAGSAPTLRVSRTLGGDRLAVEGSIPSDAKKSVTAVPAGNPMDVAAHALREALAAEKIAFDGAVVVSNRAVPAPKILAVVQGAPMRDIVRECMLESDNFLAESLYLLAASKRFAKASYRAGYQTENDYWKNLKVDLSEIAPSDGSGLSRENLISPSALVALLRDRAGNDWFVASLPVSGRSGTLRYRLGDKGMAGRVQAKTGTLDGVASLSGYVRTNGGRTVAFSVIANNFTCSTGTIRAAIDDVVTLLAAQ